MSDLNITTNSVIAANSNTVTASGTAGAAINAGQVVWLDTTVSPNLLQLANATDQVHVQAIVGVALDTALGSGQPLTYAVSGDITMVTTTEVLTAGVVYVVSDDNDGGIAPVDDPASGSFISGIGLGINGTTLRINLNPIGVQR